jgi:hypothetical protein
LKGDIGSQGIKGDKGDSGAIGPLGLKGDIGSQGLKGDQGSKGDSGAIGHQGLQGPKGDQGSKGDPGSQGLKGDKGVNPLSSIPGINVNVFSLNQVTLAWTGVAGTLRLTNPNQSPATYSVFWYSGEGTAVVEAHNGVVNNSSVDFTIGAAYQFSITVKVGPQWEKVDLVRDPTDNNWYGSTTSN